jgi:hypothetical protein
MINTQNQIPLKMPEQLFICGRDKGKGEVFKKNNSVIPPPKKPGRRKREESNPIAEIPPSKDPKMDDTIGTIATDRSLLTVPLWDGTYKYRCSGWQDDRKECAGLILFLEKNDMDPDLSRQKRDTTNPRNVRVVVIYMVDVMYATSRNETCLFF